MPDELAKIQSPAPVAPPPQPAPEPAPPIVAPTPQQQNAPRISTIRTFRADLDAAVKGENLSLATVAIKEAERRRRVGDETILATSGSNKILLASIGLVALGLAAFGIGFLYYRSTPPESVVTSTRQSLIFADEASTFDATTARSADIVAFAQRKLRTIDRKIGSIEEVILTQKASQLGAQGTEEIDLPLTGPEFVRSLGTAVPDGFARALAGEYLYGIHAWQQNHGFMLFKVSSYERAYQELLSWERRFFARDILPLLEENTSREGISEKPFKDAIIRNIDTRIVRDDAGTPILIYGFLNNENLLIAGSQETFIEVLSRFTTPRPVVR